MGSRTNVKEEIGELRVRLSNLEKYGEESGETLLGIIGDYLANHKGFEDADIFAAITRICIGPYDIKAEDLAAVWGCTDSETVYQFAIKEGLPPYLALPPLIQGLCVRFNQLTAAAA